MKFSIILLACNLMLLSGCDLSTPEDASIGEIRNALNEIEIAFNYHHIDEIMYYFDNEYLHNGDDISNVTLDWEIRLNDYQEMELSEIEIELDGDRAAVNLLRKFLVNGSVIVEQDSISETGDICYWGLVANKWKLRGNRAN